MTLIKLLVLVVLICSSIFFFSEVNRLAFFKSSGSISSGNILGVSIGDTDEQAGSELEKRGFRLAPLAESRTCLGEVAKMGGAASLYLDRSWRNGAVCLFQKDGYIYRVKWGFSIFSL